MRRSFYDLFDILWNDVEPVLPGRNARVNAPALNILECDENYTVQIAAPGLTKEEVSVRLDDEDRLVISMQKKEEKKEEAPEAEKTSDSKEVAEVETKPAPRYLRREFMHQSFEQRMALPEDADLEQIHANMENGVLEICIPKIKPEEKAPIERTINID